MVRITIRSPSTCVAQTLVFDDRSVADSLILAEDAVGKQKTPGTYLQPAIWKVVDIDVLATQIVVFPLLVEIGDMGRTFIP